jgi:molecular chaperone GrpE
MIDNKKVKLDMEQIEKLKNEIELLKQQAEEFKNKYLRALADYQNLEKRISQERIEIIRSANKYLILELLPFLDNLEKAEIFVKDPGLKMTKDHLLGVLKEIGLEEIQILNKEYDPMTAEVIEIVAGEKDNIVMEVLRKGYRLNDKILQVAQVKVSRKVINSNKK